MGGDSARGAPSTQNKEPRTKTPEQSCTPDSVRLAASIAGGQGMSSSVSHAELAVRRSVACQVLPGFALSAAARFSCPKTGRTHLPCSQLHARPAGAIAGDRWWALTPPFHPSPVGAGSAHGGGFALCCGCSHDTDCGAAPPLAVSWGNRFGCTEKESGSSSADSGSAATTHVVLGSVVKLLQRVFVWTQAT